MRVRVFVPSFWTERQLFTLLISVIIEIVESYQRQYIKTKNGTTAGPMRDRTFISSFPFLGIKVTFSAEKIVEKREIQTQ